MDYDEFLRRKDFLAAKELVGVDTMEDRAGHSNIAGVFQQLAASADAAANLPVSPYEEAAMNRASEALGIDRSQIDINQAITEQKIKEIVQGRIQQQQNTLDFMQRRIKGPLELLRRQKRFEREI